MFRCPSSNTKHTYSTRWREMVQGDQVKYKFHIYSFYTRVLTPRGMQSQDVDLTPPKNTDVKTTVTSTYIKLVFSFLN